MKNQILYISIAVLLVNDVYSQYFPDWINTDIQISQSYNLSEPAIDGSGNIFICGNYGNGSNSDAILKKYNSFGMFQWQSIYPGTVNENNAYGRKVIVAPNNFIYEYGYCSNTNFTSALYYVRKIDQQGNTISVVTYNNLGIYGLFKDFQIDNNSNIILAGEDIDYSFFYDSLIVIKYDANLTLQWVKTYADTLSFGNAALSIASDNSGNIYTAGSIYKNGFGSDFTILKYAPNGSLLWLKNYHPNNISQEDVIRKLVIENNQNLIAAGYSRSVNGNDTLITTVAKFDLSGNFIWGNTYNTDSLGTEYGKEIFAEGGNYYINIYTNYIERLIKLNNGGGLIWNTELPVNQQNIKLGNDGKFFSTGYLPGTGIKPLFIVRINQNGITEQNFLYSYNNTATDAGYFIKQFPDNRLLLVGKHGNDLLFAKFSASVTNSVNITRSNLNKPINDFSYTYDTIYINANDLPANSIVRDVNITIDTILHPADYDLVISVSHLNINDSLAVRRGGTSPNYIGTYFNDSAYANICESGSPPFTGSFKPCYPLSKFNLYPAEGAWILKIYDLRANNTGIFKGWRLNVIYEAPPIGIKPVSTEIPVRLSLLQNYPNPFNPTTLLRFDLPAEASTQAGIADLRFVKLVIFDNLGREIETLINEQLQPGTYEVEWNASNYPSGVYFYTLLTLQFNETRKMILIK